MKKRLLLGALMLLATDVVACGSNPPPQPPPPATTPPPPATTPPPTMTACDAGQTQQITTQFAGRVGTEAPKMDPEGGLVCQNVPEGGTYDSADFTMYPGFCYTVLGAGLPSVQDVDLQVTLDPAAQGFPPMLAAMAAIPIMADNIANAMTGAGTGKDCYKYAFPIPAMVKLTVKAHVGAGPVAAQVYKRKLTAAEQATVHFP